MRRAADPRRRGVAAFLPALGVIALVAAIGFPAESAPKRKRAARDAGVAATALDAGAPEDGGLDGGDDAGVDAGRLAFEEVDAGPPPAAVTLPPVQPDPRIAPVVEEKRPAPPPPAPLGAGERSREVLRTIIGLVLVLALAYMAAHPRVREWEQRLRIAQVVTAGLPFILLGMIARHPAVGVLTPDVLADISPLLRLGLGWIGFVVGFRFDAKLLAGLDAGATRFIALATFLPFAIVVAAASLLGLGLGGSLADTLRNPVFLRDAILLGTAATMTAKTSPRLFAPGAAPEAAERALRIVRIEDLGGIVGLALVAAYFRPVGTGVTWQLPGTAWLLMTIGLGATCGLLVYAMLQRVQEGPELIVLMLGSVAFAAGLAAYLHLSSVVVSFVAGVLVVNFPAVHRQRMRDVLDQLERPVYLLFLFVVGAVVVASSWTAAALLAVFVAGRLMGKQLAARAGAGGGAEEQHALAAAPVGSLAIAIVVNAQLLYPGGSIADIVVAVVGGSLLTEALVQWVLHRRATTEAA